MRRGEELTLDELLDLALRHNPRTRIAYEQARAAAAGPSAARADYYPRLELDGSVAYGKSEGAGSTSAQLLFGPSLSLTYELLDFGGRSGRVSEARQALLAANYSHDAAVQEVILAVQEAYYGLLTAKAAVAAAEATAKEAAAGRDAAQGRRQAGLATVAEVLQAATASSQATLDLQRLQGVERSLEGQLATVLGLVAGTPVTVGELPAAMPLEGATEKVEALIERALSARPDLAAAQALAQKAAARVGTIRAQGLPALSLSGSLGRHYSYAPQSALAFGDSYMAGVTLRVPLFDGFATVHEVRRAEAEAEAAAAYARERELTAALQVWSSFHELKTAAQRLATARDLMESATQSERVALGRYQEGVGSILDLLTAQAALAEARAQGITARSDWLMSLAHLAYSTGNLEPVVDAARNAGGGEEEDVRETQR